MSDSAFWEHRTRRVVLKSGLLATLGAAAAATGPVVPAARAQVDKPTFVLVHGAWHGGWCWQRLTPMLREAGYEVYTPTLTGLGERDHLASRHIGLTTHIIDVANMMFMEDVKNAVLVGHSYAGFVVAGVADRSPGRVRTLVYFDAFVPDDGKSLLDYIPQERRVPFEKAGEEKGFFDPFPIERFGVTKPEDVTWAQPRLRPQPFRTFVQPLKVTRGRPKAPHVYIRTTDPIHPQATPFAMRYRDDPAWRYLEVSGGHDAMITNPRGAADALLQLV